MIVSSRESGEPRSHSALTAKFISEMLSELSISVSDCDAVCLSKGPGSYTGLRVGSSTSKGLCFGAGKPLLAVGTPDVLCAKAVLEGLVPDGCTRIFPMIDARRMEVYTAPYALCDGEWVRAGEIEPVVVDENFYRAEISSGKVLFIGDGAAKCADFLKRCLTPDAAGNIVAVQCCPDAKSMLQPALKALKEKRFEDIAYFEPLYLKEFVATVSKKEVLPAHAEVRLPR